MKKTSLLILAIVFPWLAVLILGKPIASLVCLALQMTFVGWIPASMWAYKFVKKQCKTPVKATKPETATDILQENPVPVQEEKAPPINSAEKTLP